MENVRVNCVGAGRWGPNLVRAFQNLPDVAVGLVCDLRHDRLEVIARRIAGIEITTDIGQAIDDPAADAVVVATPVETHFELGRRALEAGKHLLVEKPLCVSVEECEVLAELAQARGLVLAVGHVFLFNPGIRKVRDYIRSGELGPVHYLSAVRTNLGPIREDVNAAWDLASHDVSIFHYWLGGPPTAVSARGESYLGGGREDVVSASFAYPGRVMGCVQASWLNPRKVREITVVGERKMAVWNDMDLIEPVRLYDKSVDMGENPPYADSFGASRSIIREGDVLIPKVAGGEPLSAECEHFIECVRTGAEPINNAAMATDVVRALAATDESLRRRGAEVQIGAPRAGRRRDTVRGAA